MSSTTDNGSQDISFDYQAQAKGSVFNKLLYNVLEAGIYGDMPVFTKVDDSSIEVSTFTAILNDTDNDLAVKMDTTTTATAVVSETNYIVVARYEWAETTVNYVEIVGVSEVEDDDIILGECIYESSSITEFDYSTQYDMNPVLMNLDNTLTGENTFEGATTFEGEVVVDGSITSNGTNTFEGTTTFNGDVNLLGANNIEGSTTFTGDLTVEQGLTVDGDFTLNGTQHVNAIANTYTTDLLSTDSWTTLPMGQYQYLYSLYLGTTINDGAIDIRREDADGNYHYWGTDNTDEYLLGVFYSDGSNFQIRNGASSPSTSTQKFVFYRW